MLKIRINNQPTTLKGKFAIRLLKSFSKRGQAGAKIPQEPKVKTSKESPIKIINQTQYPNDYLLFCAESKGLDTQSKSLSFSEVGGDKNKIKIANEQEFCIIDFNADKVKKRITKQAIFKAFQSHAKEAFTNRVSEIFNLNECTLQMVFNNGSYTLKSGDSTLAIIPNMNEFLGIFGSVKKVAG